MALETRFTLEELEYLRGLPMFDGQSASEVSAKTRECWARIHDPLRPLSGHWALHANCDFYAHSHDGWFYYRHGEMLAKVVESPDRCFDDEDFDAVHAWLDAIHAHEAATR